MRKLTRHEITKGFSVIAQWQGLRNEAAREIKADLRFYRHMRKRPLESAFKLKLLSRSKHRYVPDQHITADRVAEVIAGKLLFSEAPIPWHLPCGADDAYGERQDAARQQAKRLIAAYKVLRALERGEI